jgi:hypothetical protein
VKPKSLKQSEDMPSVRLFRDDLDKIIGLFSEYCTNVTIEDDENTYESLAEIRERFGPKIKKLQITGRSPTASLLFTPGKISLLCEPSHMDDDQAKKANLLFLRLKNLLHEHPSLPAKLTAGTRAVNIFVFGFMLIMGSIVTAPHTQTVLTLDIRHMLVILAGVAIISMLGVISGYRKGFYFLYYGRRNEVPNFWQRKKDDLLIGMFLVLAGAIFGFLISAHFAK